MSRLLAQVNVHYYVVFSKRVRLGLRMGVSLRVGARAAQSATRGRQRDAGAQPGGGDVEQHPGSDGEGNRTKSTILGKTKIPQRK